MKLQEINIQDVLSQYKFRNAGQFRAIAGSLNYDVEYNNGNLRFSREDEVFKITVEKVRSYATEVDLTAQERSMERIAQFYNKEMDFSPAYRDILRENEVDIVRWDNLRTEKDGKVKDRFTIIDHKNKICYTGRELYEYALSSGYLLDGKGSKAEQGVLSKMTKVNGRPAKIRLSKNGTSVFYKNDLLTIPDSLLGKKLTAKQKMQLSQGDIVVLSTKKGDAAIQIDKELNSVIVLSQNEISIPSQIGEYKLSSADKYLLANGFSLDSKLLHDKDHGYFIADIFMTEDKKGIGFRNTQMISTPKAMKLLGEQQKVGTSGLSSGKDPEKDPEKDPLARNLDLELKEAITRDDYEKLAALKDEGYKPSEQVIASLGKDSEVTPAQALAIEKIFGVEVLSSKQGNLNSEEVTPVNVEVNPGKELSERIIADDQEFIAAVKRADFSHLGQMMENGYQPSTKLMDSLSVEVPENTMVAVEKIIGLKKDNVPVLNEIKLAQEKPDNAKSIAQNVSNSVSKLFGDL